MPSCVRASMYNSRGSSSFCHQRSTSTPTSCAVCAASAASSSGVYLLPTCRFPQLLKGEGQQRRGHDREQAQYGGGEGNSQRTRRVSGEGEERKTCQPTR